MLLANEWKDYKILDMADGKKLEQWKNIVLERPDPQIIWKQKEKPDLWKGINAKYIRSNKGGGYWDFEKGIDKFEIKYKDFKFYIKPMGFKHVGLFPEQAVNWDFIDEKIKAEVNLRKEKNNNESIKVLNLFAYTGGATIASANAGAFVTHVDSSKGMVNFAKENLDLNNLSARLIIDDVLKFMQREIRRQNKYDAIIMDPPSYGRGPKGEIWKFEENINTLLKYTKELLSNKPLFVIVNSYTTGFSPIIMQILMEKYFQDLGGKIVSDEIGLPTKDSKMVLPCGMTSRWEND